jgi:chemotaxis protein methyltransferase CheR
MIMRAESRATDREFDFSDNDFQRVRKLIYKHAGISLSNAKSDMVYSRLARRLRVVNLSSFNDYLDQLESSNDAREWEAFTNCLTTNLTSFFRESHHFPILQEHLKKIKQPISIWCSASSTGEEPYSIAMASCEAFNTLKPPVQIIASDIDTNVLKTASQGIYAMERIEKMDPALCKKYLLKGAGANAGSVRVRDELRQMVQFMPLNLLEEQWPLSGAFDVIFCRNVMIYFDKATQAKVLNRFAPLMKSNALLFGGHSENFLYVTNAFKLRGKTVYELNPHFKATV